jgi:cytochrome c-type biogenesis protein CcmH/NrfG
MTLGIFIWRRGDSMCAASATVLACVFLSMPAWPQQAASPAAAKRAAAELKHDSALCRANASLEVCYDAIRRSPSDPALLVALGDALARANRQPDAIRAYKRAAALAPDTPEVAVKIGAAEAKLASKRAPGKSIQSAAIRQASAKRYSNTAPEGQSH